MADNTLGQKFILINGNELPLLGYGSYKAGGSELFRAIQDAIRLGYHLIDTAAYYHNEEIIGNALNSCSHDLAGLFLYSKIWPTEFDNPVRALDMSLKKLGRECLEGYLMHWPGKDIRLMLNAYEKLLREQEKGKISTLGVSNFTQRHLKLLHSNFGMWPPVNQLEIHPYFQQKELCGFCLQNKICVIAWSPLGRGGELTDPLIENIASQQGRTAAQIILRWHIQHKRGVIPKSVHYDRIMENSKIFDFSLAAEQISMIDSLEKSDQEGRIGPDPLTFP